MPRPRRPVPTPTPTPTPAKALPGALLAALLLAPLPAGAAADPAPAPDWLAALAALPSEGFPREAGPWSLALPADHAPHDAARAELWQLSLHLRDETGAPLGLQFSLLRLAARPPEAEPDTAPVARRDLYRAHVTHADPAGSRGAERLARGLAGLAGPDPDPDPDAPATTLRLDDWSLTLGPGPWRLVAALGDVAADLALAPERPPRAAGDAAPFRGYAVPRLRVEGTVETPAGPRAVAGHAWFDHLWGDLPLPGAAPVVSDRLQLHLDDGTDLTLLRSRRADGPGAPTLDALLLAPDGTATALADEALRFEPTRRWRDGARDWPVAWTLAAGDLTLAIEPVADAQAHGFAVPLWSGLVRAEGTRAGRPVAGLGTLQMPGIGRP